MERLLLRHFSVFDGLVCTVESLTINLLLTKTVRTHFRIVDINS